MKYRRNIYSTSTTAHYQYHTRSTKGGWSLICTWRPTTSPSIPHCQLSFYLYALCCFVITTHFLNKCPFLCNVHNNPFINQAPAPSGRSMSAKATILHQRFTHQHAFLTPVCAVGTPGSVLLTPHSQKHQGNVHHIVQHMRTSPVMMDNAVIYVSSCHAPEPRIWWWAAIWTSSNFWHSQRRLPVRSAQGFVE